MLANAKWRTISWRTGTKGKLKARFAASTWLRDPCAQHVERVLADIEADDGNGVVEFL
jgi:hypothetical protein